MKAKIGDSVIHQRHRLTLVEFPSKLGLPDGAAFEAQLEMTPEDERDWTLRMGTVYDTMDAIPEPLREMAVKRPDGRFSAALRPMETLISRESGKPFTKPRMMRHTGLVADLVWDRSFSAWRAERRQNVKEIDHPERREVSRGE